MGAVAGVAGGAVSDDRPVVAAMDDPAVLAAGYLGLSDTIKNLEAQAQAIRDKLKGMLLGEATAPPEGGWVYGPVTVQLVKGSERTTLNRKKLVAQGVTLEQLEKGIDITVIAPTIRVVKTAVAVCGIPHCSIGRAEDPDILEPRGEEIVP